MRQKTKHINIPMKICRQNKKRAQKRNEITHFKNYFILTCVIESHYNLRLYYVYIVCSMLCVAPYCLLERKYTNKKQGFYHLSCEICSQSENAIFEDGKLAFMSLNLNFIASK